MEERPEFELLTSFDEFMCYYWYRDELAKICRAHGMSSSGTKGELIENIKAYFQGGSVKKVPRVSRKKSDSMVVTLDTPLLACGFSFNKRFRTFFAAQIGQETFKFTADMAAAWRKVKETADESFTLQDLLDVWLKTSDYAKYDQSVCEWNQFYKDFCADEQNAGIQNKMKAAAVLWQQVKKSPQPKVYRRDLVEQYSDILRQEINETPECQG